MVLPDARDSSPPLAAQDEQRQLAQESFPAEVHRTISVDYQAVDDVLLREPSLHSVRLPSQRKHRHKQSQRKPTTNKRNRHEPRWITPTRRSFIDLPQEVLDRIYFWAIRPDCGLGGEGCDKNHHHVRNGIGTTKILCLNRTIYSQTIGLVLAHEHRLFLRNDGRKMFRSMFAFGKPGFFYGSTRTSQCPVPQLYCELNMVGLRYLALTFRYPLAGLGQYARRGTDELVDVPRSDKYEQRMDGLLKSARETEAVLWKCRSLQTLRIVLQTDQTYCEGNGLNGGQVEYFAITEDENPDMVKLLGIFVNAATCKRFLTAAEEDKHYVGRSPCYPFQAPSSSRIPIKSYRDPLVQKYNLRAEQLGVRASFDQTWEKRYIKFEHEATSTSSRALGEAADDLPLLSNCTVDTQAPARRRLKVYVNRHVTKPFQLPHECRKCYELFAWFEGLQHHLEAFPKHCIPFQRKAYNTLTYHAHHGGDRKCWTCAKSYISLKFLGKHLDQIPREASRSMRPSPRRHDPTMEAGQCVDGPEGWEEEGEKGGRRVGQGVVGCWLGTPAGRGANLS